MRLLCGVFEREMIPPLRETTREGGGVGYGVCDGGMVQYEVYLVPGIIVHGARGRRCCERSARTTVLRATGSLALKIAELPEA